MSNYFKYVELCKKEEAKLFGMNPFWLNLLGYLVVLCVCCAYITNFWLGVKVGLGLDAVFVVIGQIMRYNLGKQLAEEQNG